MHRDKVHPATIGATLAMLVLPGGKAFAQEKTTYQDHVRPIFATRCLNCHNPDKLKDDLDLTTYRGAMTGSSSGEIAKPGDPDGSILMGVIMHTQEPHMPPKGDKLSDTDIAVVRKWIADGCLETAGSHAAAPKPAVSLGGGGAAVPLAPATPMRMPLASLSRAIRPGAVLSVAAHPASRVIAFAGQQQVLLYELERLHLTGVLPTDGDSIHALGFTRDGRFLFSGGGVEGKSGRVQIWSVPDGLRVASVGDEVDVVLAADVDARRDRVALGGPSRIVKIHSVSDGKLLQRLVKHTDWITTVAYSPDGVLLATADRAGGLVVWEGASNAPYLTLGGHTASVTALDWSPDSNTLVSAGEDGRVRLWDMNDGRMIKDWVAHPGGALSVKVARDGQIVTAGRDRIPKVWEGGGKLVRQFPAMNDIALGATMDASLQTVVATDLTGTVIAWKAKDAAVVGPMESNPATLEERLAQAEQQAAKAKSESEARARTLVDAKAAFAAAQLEAGSASKQLQDAESSANAAQVAFASTQATEQSAKQAAEKAAAAVASTAQASIAASSRVEQSLAALKTEIDKDTKLQQELTTAQNEQLTLEARANETARLAAANDAPQNKTEAEAARSQASAAGEKLAAMQAKAEESSRAVRAALEESEKAKAAQAEASASQRSAANEAREADLVHRATVDRMKAAELAANTAKAAVEPARNKTTEQTAAMEKKRAAAAQAESSAETAAREASAAESQIAACRAGQLRAALDATRAELMEAEDKARPAVDAAAAADSAAAAAAQAVKQAEAELTGIPEKIAKMTAGLDDAKKAAVAAANESQSAADLVVQRTSDAAAMTSVVEALKARAGQGAQDAAYTAALAKASEALSLLGDSLKAASTARDHATARAAAAAGEVTHQLSGLAAIQSLQSSLPAHIGELRQAAENAAAASSQARALANRALEPAVAIHARAQDLEKQYADLLSLAEKP